MYVPGYLDQSHLACEQKSRTPAVADRWHQKRHWKGWPEWHCHRARLPDASWNHEVHNWTCRPEIHTWHVFSMKVTLLLPLTATQLGFHTQNKTHKNKKNNYIPPPANTPSFSPVTTTLIQKIPSPKMLLPHCKKTSAGTECSIFSSLPKRDCLGASYSCKSQAWSNGAGSGAVREYEIFLRG